MWSPPASRYSFKLGVLASAHLVSQTHPRADVMCVRACVCARQSTPEGTNNQQWDMDSALLDKQVLLSLYITEH